MYVTGLTSSSDFPTTAGAYDESYNGGEYDCVIAKLDGELTTLEASTFVGGSESDSGVSVVIDDGYVYVTGRTGSSDFPTTAGAYDESYNGGDYDVFISRVDISLTTLDVSTFVGGSSDESVGYIALDGSHVYVTGSTASSDFPTTLGAYDGSYNGGDYDVFISKLDKDLSATSPVPTVSTWGMLAMVLLTMTAGTIAFRWRKPIL